jgi:molybdopterin synthase sulfur carrier subunit
MELNSDLAKIKQIGDTYSVSNSDNSKVEVRIPTILRPYTGGAKLVSAQGSTLRDVIADLDVSHPGLAERLLDGGALRRFINLYANDEDVRFIGGLDLVVKDGDSITILPAVAGGC